MPAGLAKVQRHALAARVFLGFFHAQLPAVDAQHQRLAAPDKQADAAIVGRHLGGLHVLVDFADHLVAGIEQIIGLVAGGQGAADFIVQAGHLAGFVIHQQRVVAQLLRGGVVLLFEHVGGRVKARRQLAHAGEHHVAPRGIRGGGLHIDKGVHHVGDGRAQAAIAAFEHVLHLHQALQAAGIGRMDGVGSVGLAVEQGAVVAHHRGHLHAFANKAVAHVLPVQGIGIDGLARVTGGIDVGNVVANGGQGLLIGVQGGYADIHEAHNGCSFFISAKFLKNIHAWLPRCTAWALSMARDSLLAYCGSVA